MLTMVPFFAQMIAIVIWASLFFLLINAPLAASDRSGLRGSAWSDKSVDPFSLDAGKGRPLVWRKVGTVWVAGDGPSLSRCRSR